MSNAIDESGQRAGYADAAGASTDMFSNFEANDEQAALQWDEFLRGFDPDR
jgi:hypothetical protein